MIKYRARRKKKVAKAIERQARKLRAKGITVDVEALRNEYLTQHRNQYPGSSSESDENEDDQIDVVGGADEYDTEDSSQLARGESTDNLLSYNSNCEDVAKQSLRPNPFSIESLLCKNTWDSPQKSPANAE